MNYCDVKCRIYLFLFLFKKAHGTEESNTENPINQTLIHWICYRLFTGISFFKIRVGDPYRTQIRKEGGKKKDRGDLSEGKVV